MFFRLGFGDDQKATDDAKLYEKNYAKKYPRETSQVIYSMASIYERQNDWAKVAEHYQSYLKKYGRQALPERGNPRQRPDRRGALEPEQEARRREVLQGSHQALDQRRTGGDREARHGDADKAAKWIAEGSQATAQALWYLAEYQFAAFTKIKFPELKGAADMAKVNAWAQGSFVKWIEDKGKALKAAEDAYARSASSRRPCGTSLPPLASA